MIEGPEPDEAGGRDVDVLAVQMAEMARTLMAQESMADTLDEILGHAVRLVEGCEEAGVLTLQGGRKVRTLAASSDLVRQSDQAQHEAGQGPCFDAARRPRRAYRVADMTAVEDRWRRYAPHARELGIASAMGFSLFIQDDVLGALNLYSSKPGAFTEVSERTGWLVASHAAVAYASARSHDQLQEALHTRSDISQALGIVMERYRIGEEEAFAVLRRSSQDHNIKLRDIARTLAQTGDLPGAR